MRKYISLILLIIILFASNGYHLYFKYLEHNIKKEIKHEIRNGLKEKELTIIAVSAKNEQKISWIEQNKEFKYNNSMYDVVKSQTKGNKTYYYCINDTKEKNLISNYAKHNQRRNQVLLKIRKVLSNKYFPENFVINTKTNNTDIFLTEYQQNYTSIYLETLSPPPQV